VVTVFGELLRNSRLRAVLTQEELAERAGLSVLGLDEPELTSFIASAFGIRQLRPVVQRSNTSRAHASRLVSSGSAAR
jgi:transcriptional regulator with XRE-family HTH domain